MLIIAHIFLGFGLYKLFAANTNIMRSFTIHEHMALKKAEGKKSDVTELPMDVQIHALIHTMVMILFLVWIIVGVIWSDNSILFLYILPFQLISGIISRIAERVNVAYVIWYTLYWGVFILFNLKIAGYF